LIFTQVESLSYPIDLGGNRSTDADGGEDNDDPKCGAAHLVKITCPGG
jgi:hypothetical protein